MTWAPHHAGVPRLLEQLSVGVNGLVSTCDGRRDPRQADVISGAAQGERLDEVEVSTDDDEVGRAVDDPNQAIEDRDRAVLNADTDPSSGRVDAAAEGSRDVCVS